MQAIMYILAFASVILAFTRMKNSDRIIAAILSLFWVWNGVAYHIMYFAGINKAAYVFGVVFAVQGMLLFWHGTIKNRINFVQGANLFQKTIGGIFMIYAALIYPVLGHYLGHGFPYSPLLGVAPCPTTIFTFGMLVLVKDITPLKLIWIPLIWSLIGFNASWAFGITEDIGLLTSGLVSTVMAAYGKYRYRREGLKTVHVENY
jgi:hypothetical protein